MGDSMDLGGGDDRVGCRSLDLTIANEVVLFADFYADFETVENGVGAWNAMWWGGMGMADSGMSCDAPVVEEPPRMRLVNMKRANGNYHFVS
jgi:hypothetical protein